MNLKTLNRTYAIVAYCTLIGWIISLAKVSTLVEEDRKFTAFHLRQMLVLMLLGAVVSIIDTIFFFVPYFGLFVINGLSLALFVCWLWGLVSAFQGKRTCVPFVGRAGENILGDMFE